MVYIVFEGIDGSGKTTQIPLVEKELKKCVDTPIRILKETEIESVNPVIDVLNYARQRKELLPVDIVESDVIFLCDRSHFSSLAYQGMSKEMLEYVRQVNSFVPMPDVIIYLDHKPKRKDYDTLAKTHHMSRVYANYSNVIPIKSLCLDTRVLSIGETTFLIVDHILRMLPRQYMIKSSCNNGCFMKNSSE